MGSIEFHPFPLPRASLEVSTSNPGQNSGGETMPADADLPTGEERAIHSCPHPRGRCLSRRVGSPNRAAEHMDQPARPQSSGPWRLAIAPGSVLTVGRRHALLELLPGQSAVRVTNSSTQSTIQLSDGTLLPRGTPRDCPLSVEGLELILGDAVVVRCKRERRRTPSGGTATNPPGARDACPRVGGGSLPPVPSRSRHRRRRPGRLAPARPGRPPEPGFLSEGHPGRRGHGRPGFGAGSAAQQGRLEGEGGSHDREDPAGSARPGPATRRAS